jgi:hypothetical protein
VYGYAFNEPAAMSFIDGCRAVVESGDLNAWRRLADGLGCVYPRVLLSRAGQTRLPNMPLFRASYHRGTGDDLSADHVPTWSDAALQWILMNVVLQSAAHRIHITFEHFYFALDDREYRTLAGPPGLPELDRLLATVLCQRRLPPPRLECLSAASYVHSYSPPDDIRSLVAIEDDVSLMARTGAALARHDHFVHRHLGADILRLLLFLRAASMDNLAVLMTPYPIEG